MSDFVPLDTFRIESILMYREGMTEDEKFDIRDFVFELAIHEDMFSPTIFGTIVMHDLINLPESFPLVGGELIDVRFRTPVYQDTQLITLCVAKVGDRLETDQTNKQIYTLYLITQDRYRDFKLNISKAYDGTYDAIVEMLLKDLGSTTSLTKDTANYNQTFVCPYYSPLQACKWISGRAYGVKTDPFLFWETMDGYQFRSLHNVYSQEPYTRLYIEPSRVSDDGDRAWRRVQKYEYCKSADRMKQIQNGAWGVNLILLNADSRIVETQQYDYRTLSGTENFAKIDEFPLYPETDQNFFRMDFMYTRADMSHEGEVYRNMLIGLMDFYKIKVIVPGDSGYKAGQIIEMAVPDLSSSNVQNETLTSGRWLITSLRHLIKGNNYSCALELCKDSYAVDVQAEIGLPEVPQTDQKTAQSKDAPPPENAPAQKLLP
ncbi:hypothetical protein SHAb15599_00172 [Acinetobacter phage SH-Ab 15599]|nr:hypothetical protein SHAb15599_00172 [Acinetobacter phage SH-Ab 15599]